ncbi:MAG: type transport system permease protein [Thermosipho sp. (in: thermotogales)]|nr:type transport system permease protein [Thermosipho sp. (in: thermotogales)]
MRYLNVFKGTLLRTFSELKRYYLNTLTSFAIMTMIFYFIIVGINKFGNPAVLGESIQAIAIGYVVWMALIGTVTDLSWTIINEMSIGLIEQSFISPIGPTLIYLSYQLSNFIFVIPLEIIIMMIVFKIAGISILIPPIFLIVLMLLMIQGYGIGLMIAGVTLRFKRTQAILNLIQFGIIGVLMGNYKGIWKYVVPANGFVRILRNIINNNRTTLNDWLYMFVSSAMYIIIGILVFDFFAKLVRKRGEIAQY